MKIDQYNNPIPTDLVVLDVSPEDLTELELKKIVSVKWYEQACLLFRSSFAPIFVSAKAVQPEIHLETSLEDIGVDDSLGFELIDEGLKRWSIEDGFYHA